MKLHKFDSISFLAGAVTTAIGLLFLIPKSLDDLLGVVGNIGSWFWPVVFVAIGVAVLAPIVFRERGGTED